MKQNDLKFRIENVICMMRHQNRGCHVHIAANILQTSIWLLEEIERGSLTDDEALKLLRSIETKTTDYFKGLFL